MEILKMDQLMEVERRETIHMSPTQMVTLKHFQTKSQITTLGGTANPHPQDSHLLLTKPNQEDI